MANSTPQQLSNAIYLSPEQKALAKDTFETAVSPLRQEYDTQFKNRINQLSQQGTLFGGLGTEAIARITKDQATQEGNIAAQIGVNLGQNALQQAYAANEAAKARQFTGEQAALDRGLTTSENAADRTIQQLLAEKQIAAQQASQASQQQFAGQQAGLERQFSGEQAQAQRSLQQLLAEKGIEADKASQQAQFGFQAGQSQAQRDFQKSLTELGISADQAQLLAQQKFQSEQATQQRGLSLLMQQNELQQATAQASEQRALTEKMQNQQIASATSEAEKNRLFNLAQLDREQAFNKAAQEAGFVQQQNMFDRQNQAQKNLLALDLALKGNLQGNAVNQVLEKTLGPGYVLKPESQLALEGAAAAAGLTVDEFNNVRRAMAKGQIDDLFLKDSTQNFKSLDELQKSGIPIPESIQNLQNEINKNKQYIDAYTQLNNPSTYGPSIELFRRNIDKYNAGINAELSKIKNPNYGKNVLDEQGNPKINPDYIDNPEKSREFYQKMAQIYANGQVNAAKASSSKVICSELYRQGLLDRYIYFADGLYAQGIHPDIKKGYHLWAKHIVKIMRKSKLVTYLVLPFGRAWAYQMAYHVGVVDKPNMLGKLLETIGLPICRYLGSKKKEVSNA